ncbi:hypothetical protein LY78DRAFT_684932 [Colletotrichum sublineola]|uniref:Uncharacterized protein n=1 Tax=Colletotrichum sublineola TaxID=1173701 RepID=A0A066X211_COLSU|nr:hypothetical protein LY78DRAFT_684932 [Colletotrichum sublineola]KDN60065.1 hypothetical protein CSUB01_08871 [Colletotrichum sublineola]
MLRTLTDLPINNDAVDPFIRVESEQIQAAVEFEHRSNGLPIVAQVLAVLPIDRTGRLAHHRRQVFNTILFALFPSGESSSLAAQWGFLAATWLYNFSFSSICGPPP